VACQSGPYTPRPSAPADAAASRSRCPISSELRTSKRSCGCAALYEASPVPLPYGWPFHTPSAVPPLPPAAARGPLPPAPLLSSLLLLLLADADSPLPPWRAHSRPARTGGRAAPPPPLLGPASLSSSSSRDSKTLLLLELLLPLPPSARPPAAAALPKRGRGAAASAAQLRPLEPPLGPPKLALKLALSPLPSEGPDATSRRIALAKGLIGRGGFRSG
jgi:hypothetical protein